MPNSIRQVFFIVLREVLAALFVVSAGAKLFAIDSFELYVFSYGFFSLNFTYIFVRLCIAAELLVGIFLALGWWPRIVRLLTLLMLLAFSLFLCYAALVGRMESCQCFGQLVQFNPVESLLKNAALVLLVLLYGRLDIRDVASKRWHLPVSAFVIVAVVVAVFCISVPDSWMFHADESYYNRELIEDAVSPQGALAEMQLDEGHQLVAFITPGCPYCRMAHEKITSIIQRHGLDSTQVHYYEPADLPEGLFFDITYGQRPFIMMLDNGHVVTTYHYRNINERQIVRHLR